MVVWGFRNPPSNFPPKIAVRMEGFLNPPNIFQGDVVSLVECWYRSGGPSFVDSCSGSNFHFSGKKHMGQVEKHLHFLFLESEKNLGSQNR